MVRDLQLIWSRALTFASFSAHRPHCGRRPTILHSFIRLGGTPPDTISSRADPPVAAAAAAAPPPAADLHAQLLASHPPASPCLCAALLVEQHDPGFGLARRASGAASTDSAPSSSDRPAAQRHSARVAAQRVSALEANRAHD